MTEYPTRLGVDYRLGGVPRYYLSSEKEPFVKIPEEIRKCAAYVAYWDGQAHKLLGTCFWIGLPIPDLHANFVYVVTAKHLIEQTREKAADKKVYLRANFVESGAHWIETDINDWHFHPTECNVDVAVSFMPLGTNLDHRFIPLHAFISDEIITNYDIGIGDEVFLTGLFGRHTGTSRNIPIVRTGNIAAMPEEPVKTLQWTSEMEAYLIESRSTGGLSGSPVFVNLGPVRKLKSNVHIMTQPFYLLGLIHGHWDATVEDEHINMGIAIVVPTKKILEVIDQSELKRKRDVIETVERAKLAATPDSSSEGT